MDQSETQSEGSCKRPGYLCAVIGLWGLEEQIHLANEIGEVPPGGCDRAILFLDGFSVSLSHAMRHIFPAAMRKEWEGGQNHE